MLNSFAFVRWQLAILLVATFCLGQKAHAGYLSKNQNSDLQGYLLAQSDDDSYDPFSDYSEFDEDSDEEADVYFFKHGRLLSIGLFGGMKEFTGNLNSLYTGGATYGLYLGYFFDMRFAMQLGFSTGDYPFTFTASNGSGNVSGNVSFTIVQLDFKYYMNTQNIANGIADLNPYWILGVADVFRTYTIAFSTTGGLSNATGSAWGLDLGGGIEVPVMRKKAYFGLQGTFRYVNFPDANSLPYLDAHVSTTLAPSGYQYDLLGIFGFNF